MAKDISQLQCSRRMFLIGTATTFAGALMAACGTDDAQSVSAKDVPVGSAIIVGNVIIAQPTEGEYRAYSTACPHANAVIDEINGDIARCPKHGSEFSLKDGSVITGPARDALYPKEITVEGNSITI